ncbi:MAG: NifU family protein [Alphaproteobacteria bacterium]
MFIQTQDTGDDAKLRFLPGRAVLGEGERTFASAEAAGQSSPLAAQIFAVGEVAEVVLGPEHVDVRIVEGADWSSLKPGVLGALMAHFMSGAPVLAEAPPPAPEEELDEATAEIVADVKELLATRIAPAVEPDGGRASYHSFKDGVLFLELGGSAKSLLGAIGNMLRHYIPEIVAVRDSFDAIARPGLETPTAEAIQRLLDEQINPAVASHGGFISLIDVQEDIAYIELGGGCQGCGMADVTLKQGVEKTILETIPGITAVRDVTDHASGDNPYYSPGAK